MPDNNVVSIAKVVPNNSQVVVTELSTGGVVISILGCLGGAWERTDDLYLFDETALVLLDVLEDWKSAREPVMTSEFIAKFAMEE